MALTGNVLVWIVFLFLSFCLDHAAEYLDETSTASSALSAFGSLYQTLVTVGPRKPRSHFVRLVMIKKGTEPDAVTYDGSPCASRPYIARLMNRLMEIDPAVIVVDREFGDINCTERQNDLLEKALAKVLNRHIPVLAGCTDFSASESKNRPDKIIQDRLREEHALLMDEKAIR